MLGYFLVPKYSFDLLNTGLGYFRRTEVIQKPGMTEDITSYLRAKTCLLEVFYLTHCRCQTDFGIL